MDDEEKKFIEIIKFGKLSKEGKKFLSEISFRKTRCLIEKYGVQFNSDSTIEVVSKQFHVARKRIKEIEDNALRKLRKNRPDGNVPDAK